MNEILLDDILIKKESRIRPNLQRAKTAQILILVMLALRVIMIFSSYLQYGLLVDLQNGEDISEEVLNSNDLREQAINIIYILILIVSAVTFIQWFRRAYYNLMIRATCERTDGWASGCWFIPIVSLYLPYSIMRELWSKTSRLIQLSTKDENESKPIDLSLIGFWWALWVISNILSNVVGQIYKSPIVIQDFIDSTAADIIVSIIFIPTAILAVFVIKKFSEKEEKLLRIENGSYFV